MGTKVITPPNLTTLIPPADLRQHLRIAADGSEDELMAAYLAAAHAAAEHYAGRPIGAQTLELAQDSFPQRDGAIALGAAVTGITSVKYLDTDGAEQTVASDAYTLDDYSSSLACWLIPGADVGWPTAGTYANAVKVRFVAGDLPNAVRAALLLMMAWLFENRGDASDAADIQPPAAKALLDTVKVWGA